MVIDPFCGVPSWFIATLTTTVVLSASDDRDPTFQQDDTATRSDSFSPADSGGPEGAAAVAAGVF